MTKFKKISLSITAIFVLLLISAWVFYKEEMIAIGQIYLLKEEVTEMHNNLAQVNLILKEKNVTDAIVQLKEAKTPYAFFALANLDPENSCKYLKKALDFKMSIEVKESLLSSELYSMDKCFERYVEFARLKIKIKNVERNGLKMLKKFGIKEPEKDLENKLVAPFLKVINDYNPKPDGSSD